MFRLFVALLSVVGACSPRPIYDRALSLEEAVGLANETESDRY